MTDIIDLAYTISTISCVENRDFGHFDRHRTRMIASLFANPPNCERFGDSMPLRPRHYNTAVRQMFISITLFKKYSQNAQGNK